MAGGKGKGRARGCVEWRGLGAVMGVWRMCVWVARVYVRAGVCGCAGGRRAYYGGGMVGYGGRGYVGGRWISQGGG